MLVDHTSYKSIITRSVGIEYEFSCTYERETTTSIEIKPLISSLGAHVSLENKVVDVTLSMAAMNANFSANLPTDYAFAVPERLSIRLSQEETSTLLNLKAETCWATPKSVFIFSS